jgi:hypothetical protein
MADITLDGNPSGAPFNGSEVTAYIQAGGDVSKSINELLTFINAAAQLAGISQVTGLETALAGKQALSAILTTLAALSATTGLMVQTGAESFAKRSLADSDDIEWDNSDGSAGNPTPHLTDTGVTPGNVGAPSRTILGQVDAKGRLSAFIDELISIAQAQINDLPITGANGGTGVSNSGKTITLGGNISTANSFTTSGNFAVTQTYTGTTTVTFPTSGTLATTSQLPTASALTKTDDTNVTVTLGGTPGTALMQPVSLTMGWTGSLSAARGGTGVNNGSNTITIGGSLNFANNFTTSGNFPVTHTYTATTNVTFPTSGTLATTAQLPTPAALTKTDDTNVTATLTGTPASALLQSVNIALGWTGTLSGTRGGTGVNNGSNTITIAGNLNFANSFQTIGNFSVIQRYSASTDVTFPTSGTLSTQSKVRRTVAVDTTLTGTDNDGQVIFTPASGATLVATLPRQATEVLPVGFNGWIVNQGVGDVSVVRQAGDVFESQTYLVGPGARMYVSLDDTTGGVNTWRGYGGTIFEPAQFTKTLDGTVANGTYCICNYLPFDFVALNASFKATGGAGTGTLNFNGSNITGGALAFSTTDTRQALTAANTASRGAFLNIVISGVSALTNATATVEGYTRRNV